MDGAGGKDGSNLGPIFGAKKTLNYTCVIGGEGKQNWTN
jgi:hypothetical protein